jgi:uncharacterized protein with HEPN domain
LPFSDATSQRPFQIISEAAIRLGSQAEIRCPGLSWRNIRGMGNWLRHQYERIELSVIWQTAQTDLPQLKAAVLHALNPPSAGTAGPSVS